MIKVIMKIGALAVVVPVALLAVYVLVPYFWFWTPADTVCPADRYGSAPVAETAAIAQELEQFRAEQGALGLQAALVMPDGTMRQFALGTASKDDRCPITHEHAFYIGSISKLVTSVLVWDALRSETLSMDAPVTDTLSLKQFPPDLTVHELLHHTSGAVELTQTIGHLLKLLQPFASFSPDDLANESDWFDVARRGDFHYANSNFMLLGRLLEVSSGRQYPELLADTLNELDPEIRMFWRDRPSELMVPRGYDRDVLPWPGVLDVTPFRRPIETGCKRR